MKDRFIAKVFITEGKVDFKVYEADTLEEYMPAHIYNASGAFVGEIHKECESALKDIAQKCFYTEYFKWEQSQRILQFIKNTYGAEPEFLWKNLPECAALRAPGKKSWFAVVGRIPKEKIDVNGEGMAECIGMSYRRYHVKAYEEIFMDS